MNPDLAAFAREKIKHGLAQLPASYHEVFNLMYGRAGGKRSVEDAKAMPVNDVVDQMPAEKLDWAMTQVDNSLKKFKKP